MKLLIKHCIGPSYFGFIFRYMYVINHCSLQYFLNLEQENQIKIIIIILNNTKI